jgi:PAS domain S-box-containing protein
VVREVIAKVLGWLECRKRRVPAIVNHDEGDVVLVLDAKGRIVEANPTAAAAYGFAREELLLFQFRDLLAPEERARIEQERSHAWERPEGYVFETTQKRKDGSTFPVNVVVHAMELAGKRYYQAFIKTRDSQPAVESNAAPRRDPPQIGDAAPVALWATDGAGCSTYANQRARELFDGKAPSTREEWARFLSAEALDGFWQSWEEGVASGETFRLHCELILSGERRQAVSIACAPHAAKGFAVACMESAICVEPPASRATESRGTWRLDEAMQTALEVSEGSVDSVAFVKETQPEFDSAGGIDFPAYLRKLTNHILQRLGVTPGRIALHFEVDSVPIPSRLAIRCAFVISELVTNAIRHAFSDNGAGSVNIALRRVSRGRLQLKVSDDGAQGLAASSSPAKSCSGLALVRVLVEQVDGELEIKRDRGFHAIATFSGNAAASPMPLETAGAGARYN